MTVQIYVTNLELLPEGVSVKKEMINITEEMNYRSLTENLNVEWLEKKALEFIERNPHYDIVKCEFYEEGNYSLGKLVYSYKTEALAVDRDDIDAVLINFAKLDCDLSFCFDTYDNGKLLIKYVDEDY